MWMGLSRCVNGYGGKLNICEEEILQIDCQTLISLAIDGVMRMIFYIIWDFIIYFLVAICLWLKNELMWSFVAVIIKWENFVVKIEGSNH